MVHRLSRRPRHWTRKCAPCAVTTLGLTGDPANAARFAPHDSRQRSAGEAWSSCCSSRRRFRPVMTCPAAPAITRTLPAATACPLPVGVAPSESRPPSGRGGRSIRAAIWTRAAATAARTCTATASPPSMPALFDRALMYDGRVFVLDAETVSGGHGQRIRTPESGQGNDLNPLDGLMEFTMKGPIVNDNEMRGFLYTDLATPDGLPRASGAAAARRRRYPVQPEGRCRRQLAGSASAPAFSQPAATADAADHHAEHRSGAGRVTSTRRSSWTRRGAASWTAIRRHLRCRQDRAPDCSSRRDRTAGWGATAATPATGSPMRLITTSAFPSSGAASAVPSTTTWAAGWPRATHRTLHAFRTPVAAECRADGAVWPHRSLRHARGPARLPRQSAQSRVDYIRFHAAALGQFQRQQCGLSGGRAASRARRIAQPNFAAAEALLPGRVPDQQRDQPTGGVPGHPDRSLRGRSRLHRQWAPTEADDPDGHMLVRDHPQGTPAMVDAQRASNYPTQIALNFPAQPARTHVRRRAGLWQRHQHGVNTGAGAFVQRSETASVWSTVTATA